MTEHRGGLGDRTLAGVCEAISEPTPVPGGGSAAAIAGALAASLLEMAALISRRRAADDEVERFTSIGERAARIRQRMLELADLDARAFEGVMAARRLPRSSESEAQSRVRAIQQAAENAARVPQATAELGIDLGVMADELSRNGSKAVASDIAVGRALARVAISGGRANVEANLADMTPADRQRFEQWLADQPREEGMGEGQID